MREAWGRWACVAIGASVVSASMADAKDVAYTAGVTAAATTPGKGVLASVPAKPVRAAPNRFVVVAMPPALTLDPGAAPQARDYDLRVVRAYQASKLTPIKQSLRARGTGMRDAYLHGSSGLRASVGSSYHMQYRASDTGAGAAAGSAALMRLPIGAVNLRDGYENYAPVAMVGYDARVTDRVKVGVEGGMMVGRSTAMYADETVPGLRAESHTARNPVADLVMSYAF